MKEKDKQCSSSYNWSQDFNWCLSPLYCIIHSKFFSSWPHLLLALIDSIQTQTLILEEPEPLVMMSFSVRSCSAYPFTITTGKGLPRGTQVGHQDSTRDPLSLQETMGQTRSCILYLCVLVHTHNYLCNE